MTIKQFYNACVNAQTSPFGLMIYASVEDFDNANSNWKGYHSFEIEDIPDNVWNLQVAKFQFCMGTIIIAVKTIE